MIDASGPALDQVVSSGFFNDVNSGFLSHLAGQTSKEEADQARVLRECRLVAQQVYIKPRKPKIETKLWNNLVKRALQVREEIYIRYQM